MARDTKSIIVSTLLEIITEDGKLTISEIHKRSYITRATIMNNFPGGINEIIEYVYSEIVKEINNSLKKIKLEELNLERFTDTILPMLWENRKTIHILYTSSIPFCPTTVTSRDTWLWAESRYNSVAKNTGMSPFFSGRELLQYWNNQLLAILNLWLGSKNPLNLEEFRPIFLFLVQSSICDLISEEDNLMKKQVLDSKKKRIQ